MKKPIRFIPFTAPEETEQVVIDLYKQGYVIHGVGEKMIILLLAISYPERSTYPVSIAN